MEYLNNFEVTVLEQSDLSKVSGGLAPTQTQSACHIDGVNDNEDGSRA